MERYLPAELARNPKLVVAAVSFVAGAATAYAAYSWAGRLAPAATARAGGSPAPSTEDDDASTPPDSSGTPPDSSVSPPLQPTPAPPAGGARAKAPLDAALPRRLTGWVAARAGATGLAPDKVVRVALEWARREGGDAVFSVPPVVDGADDGAPVDGVFLVDEAHVRWLDAVVSLGVVGSKGEGLQRVLAAAAAADADVVFGVIRCRTGGCDEAAEAVDKVAAAKTA